MVAATYEATKQGAATVIGLAALLSISVGIFNLLPFPPLDGGQMLIAFAELLRRGRRLSIQVQQALMSGGLAVVLLLTVVVLFIDIQRFTNPDRRQAPKPEEIERMEEPSPGNPSR
jgi:membrane-associated protease RseP (regulator of RpoE activity)